jgi:hypothetical protein
MIGVIDPKKQRCERFSYKSNAAVSYYAYDGYIYPNVSNSGSGSLKEGDTVTVKVDRKQKCIKWLVGKVPKHSCRCDMFNIKDVIEWVE